MATPHLMEYVSPVERLRLKTGWTRSEACRRSGIAIRTMRNAEKIGWEPHTPTVSKIAELYGVDPGRLLEDMRRYAAQQKAA